MSNATLENCPKAGNGVLRIEEKTCVLWDGMEIFYRAVNADVLAGVPQEKRKALIIFHRGHEHSGRYLEMIERLNLPEMPVFAWDAPGHGKSPGERGYAPSFGHLVKSADSFVAHVAETYGVPVENMIVLGHSVGAVTVAAWVHDYAPPIRAMILGTPAFRIKLYVPFAIPMLRLGHSMFGKFFIKSYVKASMLTHDAEMARNYAEDKLITRDIAVNILLGMRDTAERLIADAAAIHVPTLMLLSGADLVVDAGAQHQFFDRLSSKIKAVETYDGFYHAVFHEKDRAKPIARCRQFIVDALVRTAEPADPAAAVPINAAARAEYERLTKPASIFNPKTWMYGFGKLWMNTLGRLSYGIRLGWRTGFDSGPMLDHVYGNTARGALLIGTLFDRVYLNGVGWQGIRQRKVNMETLLGKAFEAHHTAGRAIQVIDIASGPGRYLLDAVKKYPAYDIGVLLHDRDPEGIGIGKKIAEEMQLPKVQIQQGDAFDGDHLAGITPRPNVTIVSGLYELFQDNAMLTKSLTGIHRGMQDGGYLLYTNQPWHPQLELIARVLINRDHVPWIMRCRCQAEMDGLVRNAGFEKVEERIDDWGIFTVSLARKK